MNRLSLFPIALGLVASAFIAAGSNGAKAEPKLSAETFEKTKTLYFQRCAGCHGVLRKGATGTNLEPEWTKKMKDGTAKTGGTLKLGQKRLEKIITLGTEGGMNNFDDIFSKQQIANLATYIQMEPPVPAELSIEEMKKSVKVYVEAKDYPSKPKHDRNWKNFFLVIERDAGKVAIVDGDKKEIVAHIPTGYAVHVVKTAEKHKTEKVENMGRFWYTMGRDGKLTKIDLWQTPDKMRVAEVQVAYDARDVAVSGDGKYVIGGGYWPPHFVIVDAMTMMPLKVVSTRGVNIDGAYVNESRVAAVYTTPLASSFLVSAKELGQMWQVYYKDLKNLKIVQMDTHKFLHDGFFDPTGRYFQIAANASNRMEVVDSVKNVAVASIETGKMPHPGPGANWIDPKCGPVGGTMHIGEGKLTAWGNDPKGNPDNAWKVCYKTELDGPGLFMRTHPNSDYVLIDQVKHPEPEIQQSIQVIDKKTGKIAKTIRVTTEPGKVALHMEFNADGSEFWVSVWNRKDSLKPNGEIVVYDTKTLKEKARIKGLYAPTGKFNVSIRINHVT